MVAGVLLPGFLRSYISKVDVESALERAKTEERVENGFLTLDFSPSDGLETFEDLKPDVLCERYREAQNSGRVCFLVFCDDAYAALLSGLEEKRVSESPKMPIIPLLVGSVGKLSDKHYKFWYSIDAELCCIFNYLRDHKHKLNDTCWIGGFDSAYTQHVTEQLFRMLVVKASLFTSHIRGGYAILNDVSFSDSSIETLPSNSTVFLIGHGDEKHEKLFRMFCDNKSFRGRIFTNAAGMNLFNEPNKPLKLPDDGRIELFCVDVDHRGTGTLQDKMVTLLFKLLIRAESEGSDAGKNIHEYLKSVRTVRDRAFGEVCFGDDFRLELPLVVNSFGKPRLPPTAPSAPRLSTYQMACFQDQMDENFKKAIYSSGLKVHSPCGVSNVLNAAQLFLDKMLDGILEVSDSCKDAPSNLVWLSIGRGGGVWHSSPKGRVTLSDCVYKMSQTIGTWLAKSDDSKQSVKRKLTGIPVQINLLYEDIPDNGAVRLLVETVDGFITPAVYRAGHRFEELLKNGNLNLWLGRRDGEIKIDDEDDKNTICQLLSLCENEHQTASYLYLFFDALMSASHLSCVAVLCERRLALTSLRALKTQAERLQTYVNCIVHDRDLCLHSTKSAIGSIMSRNGSHNIGSHVLSALTHNVGTMPDDRVLYQYIQHRMDYIASATTDFPDWSVPTKFVGEVMKLFYSQRHLLEHIAGSEGLHAYEFQGKGFDPAAPQHNCIKIVVRKVCEGQRGHGEEDEWSKFEFDKARTLFVRAFLCGKGERISTDWANDVTLALPGGILGQHAFYNIVENIIRNAAKHAWSSLDSNRSDNPDNLEIYIDLKEDDDGVVSFTIGDNVSRLFPYKEFWAEFFDYLENNEQGKRLINNCDLSSEKEKWWLRKGLIDLEKLSSDSKKIHIPVEMVKKAFALPLRYCPAEPYCDQVRNYLDGLGESYPVESLPPWYRLVQKYVNDNWNDKFSKDNKLKAILIGLDPGDGTLGRRLPVPLHHRQEVELAKPFIDLGSNQLRQSSWGLAEMKISAGYLRRAKLPVVGGLTSDDSANPLIIPIGMPLQLNKSDIDVLNLHMGYRFWISKPKSILILVDKASKWAGIVSGPGIGVCDYADAMAKVGLMADYDFVIVDHEFKPENKEKEDRNCLKLPFHTIYVSDVHGEDEWRKEHIYGGGDCAIISRKIICGAESVEKLEYYVYNAWLQFLKKRRGIGDGKLTIKIKISKGSGCEQGLITNRDIWRMVFRECFHTVVEPLSEEPNLSETERLTLFILSHFPIRVDDERFKGVSDVDRGLRTVLEQLDQFLFDVIQWHNFKGRFDGGMDAPDLICVILEGMKQSRKSFRAIELAKTIRRLLTRGTDVTQDRQKLDLLDRIYDVVRDMNKHSFGTLDHPLFRRVKDALAAANNTSDVFLRKYEERIATLPSQYMAASTGGECKELDFNDVGVCIGVDSQKNADISYNRHDFDGSPVYSEPISGSQSYMNLLANIKKNDAQLALRLAENGLLRIVIIDERVCSFIASRDEKIARIYESMHISVVDTRKGFAVDNASNPLKNITYVAHNGKDVQYDVLIIHQGVIDKWWPQHAKEDVSKLLKLIRASGFARFIVITTGRGRPDNIPEDEKVLPFSSIEALLFRRYPEKLTLVNSLMNILPYESEKEEYK